MTLYLEPATAKGAPLVVVDIPEGSSCPSCHRSPRVHVPKAWLDRARTLKRYVDSGRVAFKKDVAAELRYLRRELRWVAFQRRQEASDNAEWRRALEWVEADKAAVEAELLDTVATQIPIAPDETTDDYVARLRAYRAALRRIGDGSDASASLTLLSWGETKRR